MLEKLKQAAVNLAALDLERVALQALRQNEQAVLDFKSHLGKYLTTLKYH